MKSQRLISGLMAGALAVSMSAPAFAANTDKTQTMVVTATVASPTLDITVPATTTVALNPYGMAAPIGETGSTSTSAYVPTGSMTITNASEVSLDIAMKHKLEVKSGSTLTFKNAALDPDSDKTKMGFMQAYIVADATADDSGYATNLTADVKPTEAAKIATITTTEATTKNMATVEGTSGTNTNAHIILDGELVRAPQKESAPSSGTYVDDDWDATADEVTITMAFTFTPATAAAEE